MAISGTRSLETPSESRAKVLAYVGVSYGIGFACGPALGGLLGDVFGLSFVALVSFMGSLVSLLWCWRFLEEPTAAPGSSAGTAVAFCLQTTAERNGGRTPCRT